MGPGRRIRAAGEPPQPRSASEPARPAGEAGPAQGLGFPRLGLSTSLPPLLKPLPEDGPHPKNLRDIHSIPRAPSLPTPERVTLQGYPWGSPVPSGTGPAARRFLATLGRVIALLRQRAGHKAAFVSRLASFSCLLQHGFVPGHVGARARLRVTAAPAPRPRCRNEPRARIP